MEKAPRPQGFLRWSSKNMKNQKKMDFQQKLPDTICVSKGEKTHFRAHYLFWPYFFDQNSVNQEKL